MDNQGYTDTAGTRINLQKRIQKTEIQGYTNVHRYRDKQVYTDTKVQRYRDTRIQKYNWIKGTWIQRDTVIQCYGVLQDYKADAKVYKETEGYRNTEKQRDIQDYRDYRNTKG